jgi:hypothetical protein
VGTSLLDPTVSLAVVASFLATVVGGNDNLGYPAFRVDADTGVLRPFTLLDYESGPKCGCTTISGCSRMLSDYRACFFRYYNLELELRDNGTKPPHPQSTFISVLINIVDVCFAALSLA